MHKVIRSACIFTLLGISQAYAHEPIKNYVPNAQLVGEGRASLLIWDIYDARLFAPDGKWHENEPYALELNYLQPIEANMVVKHAISEMRTMGFTDEAKLSKWHSKMQDIFPDINPGTVITGIKTTNGATIFYENIREIGRIEDPEFTSVFFKIWLDQKTSTPVLRQSLLGIQPKNEGHYHEDVKNPDSGGGGNAS